MSKYAPLTDFLATQGFQEVAMSFADIERVIRTRLPASKCYPAWWSNNASNNVMTRAWLAAGFRTERVDTAGERLVFRRAGGRPAAMTEASAQLASAQLASARARLGGDAFFERLRARLGGSVQFVDGVDLTQPADEAWDAEG